MQQGNENSNALSIIPNGQGGIMTTNDSEAMKEFRLKCQGFIEQLNRVPAPESIDQTFDKKAFTIMISHIETTLDEYFFGLWETENFRWSVVANEIVGALDLVVIHPVTGMRMRRTGAAAIEIQVDAVPEEIKNNKRKKNEWALDLSNKKSGALDMGFPKLKTECLKNAANSLGKMFGRDINRGAKADTFKGLLREDAVTFEVLHEIFTLKKEFLSPEDMTYANRIINNRETKSYFKLYSLLQKS